MLKNSLPLKAKKANRPANSGDHQSHTCLPLVRLRLRRRCLLLKARMVENDGQSVLLTREKGKNGQLAALLDKKCINWLEVPLIESAAGPDRGQLAGTLQSENFDWIVITSPEAAAVFLEGWREAGSPQVKIAVVGSASGRVLENEGVSHLLQLAFTPSKANAAHLSAELPLEGLKAPRVLYPASAKAKQDLEEGLRQRGVSVRRLDTYDTVAVARLETAEVAAARSAAVVTVASPSALKAWLLLTGGSQSADVAFACIGSTSARAAKKLGLSRIYYPESPGMDGFVQAIEDALQRKDPADVTL